MASTILNRYEDCPSCDEIIKQLFEHGIILSISVGPARLQKNIIWSVNCCVVELNKEFEKPFAAKDYYHSLQIAWLECRDRGWLNESSIIKKTDSIVVS